MWARQKNAETSKPGGICSEMLRYGGIEMSVKIKVSYECDSELDEVVKLLSPILKTIKKQPANGKFKRAYITVYNKKNKCYN